MTQVHDSPFVAVIMNNGGLGFKRLFTYFKPRSAKPSFEGTRGGGPRLDGTPTIIHQLVTVFTPDFLGPRKRGFESRRTNEDS